MSGGFGSWIARALHVWPVCAVFHRALRRVKGGRPRVRAAPPTGHHWGGRVLHLPRVHPFLDGHYLGICRCCALNCAERTVIPICLAAHKSTGSQKQQGFVDPHGRQRAENSIYKSTADNGRHSHEDHNSQSSTDIHIAIPQIIGQLCLKHIQTGSCHLADARAVLWRMSPHPKAPPQSTVVGL